jgi:hypothetical protein
MKSNCEQPSTLPKPFAAKAGSAHPSVSVSEPKQPNRGYDAKQLSQARQIFHLPGKPRPTPRKTAEHLLQEHLHLSRREARSLWLLLKDQLEPPPRCPECNLSEPPSPCWCEAMPK